MKYLVELPVDGPDGRSQVVGVEIEQAAEGLVKVSRPGQVVARAAHSLGEMLAAIRPVADSFVGGFADMTNAPDDIGGSACVLTDPSWFGGGAWDRRARPGGRQQAGRWRRGPGRHAVVSGEPR